MKLNKIYLICFSLLLVTITACKKGDNDFFYKEELLPITLKGYNGSGEKLVVKLDDLTVPGDLEPNAIFEQNSAYTFKEGKSDLKLTVTEKSTGKQVLEKELKKGEGKVNLSFLYLDGKVGPMPEKPALETGKIKLVYKFQPTITNYTEPVDIVVGKYFFTPQVFEEITRAKNVKPNEFTEPITLSTFSTARQEYNGVMTSVLFLVRICKAGTNIPYTEGTEYLWNTASSTAPKPSASAASSKLYIFSERPESGTMRFNINLEQ